MRPMEMDIEEWVPKGHPQHEAGHVNWLSIAISKVSLAAVADRDIDPRVLCMVAKISNNRSKEWNSNATVKNHSGKYIA